jgi:hypothetical protein
MTGWIVGAQGAMYSTTDGGQTWNPVDCGTTRNVADVYFRVPGTGWAVGQFGTILRTTDGGATWTFRTSGTTMPLRSTSFADEATGWIVGNGGVILKTETDAGQDEVVIITPVSPGPIVYHLEYGSVSPARTFRPPVRGGFHPSIPPSNNPAPRRLRISARIGLRGIEIRNAVYKPETDVYVNADQEEGDP